jgi:UDP-N-acetylmuramate--alanine ligase
MSSARLRRSTCEGQPNPKARPYPKALSECFPRSLSQPIGGLVQNMSVPDGQMLNDFGGCRSFHFVGAGGVGMSALAGLLLGQGFRVSGSDLADGPYLQRLRGLGAAIHLGHSADHLGDAGAVVVSSAVPSDNPEVAAAVGRGIPVIHRSELLAELMRYRQGIAVAGSHGKTTTTAMIGHLLEKAGWDPSVAVGASVVGLGGNFRVGAGRHLVAEADESDRSLLRLNPVYAVVTNVDLDHTDQYRDADDLAATFSDFMNRIPFYGAVVAFHDDPLLRSALRNVHRRVLTYGLEPDADILIADIGDSGPGVRFTLRRGHSRPGVVNLRLPGRHNAINAAAAAAVGLALGIRFNSIAASLESFAGVERRLEVKGEKNGVTVIDDYGHHPSEIRAAIAACRGRWRRILLVFQPHRYTRTLHLLDRFADAFDDVEELYLLDIYGAGEEPLPGVTSRLLEEKVSGRRSVHYVPSRRELLAVLRRDSRPGDLVLTMGAGNVGRIGEEFLERAD